MFLVFQTTFIIANELPKFPPFFFFFFFFFFGKTVQFVMVQQRFTLSHDVIVGPDFEHSVRKKLKYLIFTRPNENKIFIS